MERRKRQTKTSKWQAFLEKSQPFREKTGKVFRVIGLVFKTIGIWIYRLRSVLLAIPVALAALKLAEKNMERLPEMVGINLQASGEYAYLIPRDVAVMGPLAVTALCFLLMFCSRRVVYPWLISIFTLVLPILIWVTNIFPA